MFELIESIVNSSNFWTEIRCHIKTINSLGIKKGEIEEAKSSIISGIGIRVLVEGVLGFSSCSKINKSSIKSTFQDAYDAAKFSASGKKKKISALQNIKPITGSFTPEIKDSLLNHSLEEKMQLVIETDKKIRKFSSLIQSSECRYTEVIDEKVIVTSDGVRVYIFDMKPELRVTAIASKNGEIASATESLGISGGWDDLFKKKNLDKMIENACKISIELLDAEVPDGEKTTVVLDPALVGLLAHEAIGHTVEADFVLAGSVASGKIGQKVASELVTLIDSGHSEIKPNAGGSIFVDDEGVPAEKVVIIENGILKSYLHNRETAKIFDVQPTGNARAYIYSDEPLIRMRNTCILPGTSKVEEIIDEVKDGYLLKGAKNGQADANAEFMFAVQEAYKIKNGKIGKLMRGVTISGNGFEVLKSVSALSSNFDWDLGSGYCGKKQKAKVDGGGPYLRCVATIGGKK